MVATSIVCVCMYVFIIMYVCMSVRLRNANYYVCTGMCNHISSGGVCTKLLTAIVVMYKAKGDAAHSSNSIRVCI